MELEFSKDDKKIRLTVRTDNRGALNYFILHLEKRFKILGMKEEARNTFVFAMELKRGIILKKDQIASVIGMDLRKSGLQ
ncbi:TPA: hypothetical protein H1012_00825 [archaeon]|nr:hypothetical protein [Candidatus Naiadarchaeales archaeon SRR2090159.bin1288]